MELSSEFSGEQREASAQPAPEKKVPIISSVRVESAFIR